MSMHGKDYADAAKKAEESTVGYIRTHVTLSLCVACFVLGFGLGKFF